MPNNIKQSQENLKSIKKRFFFILPVLYDLDRKPHVSCQLGEGLITEALKLRA